MEQELRLWLTDRHWTADRLFAWLRGAGVSLREGEEPYSVVLQALPMGAMRFEAETLLATRLASVLEREPEKAVLGNGRNQILYNLLMLCSGIPFHLVLWEPLCRLYAKAREHGTLDGDWRRIPLGAALRIALVSQQADARFQETWYETIRERPDPLLRGLPPDGMEGIRLLPGYNQAGEKTDYIRAVGKGLKLLTNYLEQFGNNKKKIFRKWVDRVTVTQTVDLWCYQILKQADAEKWPDWAATCLSLYFVIDTFEDETRRVCIWNRILQIVLEPNEYAVEGELLSHLNEDKAVIVRVPGGIYEKFLRNIAPELDYFRRTHDYPSPKGVVEELIHGLSYVESGVRDEEVKERLISGRKRTLLAEGIPCST